jgi:holo-[acyl-carrier protein] synthase
MVFTEQERAAAESKPALAAVSYALCFATKEACAKALGTGIGAAGWRDMEVTLSPGGAAELTLTSGALARLQTLAPEGCEARAHVAVTRQQRLAAAFVVIEGRRSDAAIPTPPTDPATLAPPRP